MTLVFTVWGVAQPKGSMRAFVPKGLGRAVVTDGNRKVKGWGQLVAHAAHDAFRVCAQGDAWMIFEGPVRIEVAFYLPRPKRLTTLSRRGPAWHVTKPDWDKLARAVCDALTGVVYRDDRQVVEAWVRKGYANVGAPPRVDVRVEPTDGVSGRAVGRPGAR